MFESEIKVMELIWEKEPVSAKDLSVMASERIGWNKNTTYTVIKKLETKGYIRRSEPGFICTSLISKGDVCKAETQDLIDKLFDGSKKLFLSALLDDEVLSEKDIDELRKLIEKR